MRLVIISDTHDRHESINIPDGDVLIHAGDFTMNGGLRYVSAFGKWFRSLSHSRKLIIAGNHELTFEHTLELGQKALGDGRDGLTYLQDSGVEIGGITFWGSPWQPAFNDWAFNLPRGAAIASKWRRIPDETDVLITHGPPMGILDFVHNEHVGCADLLERVREVRPRVHAFGHIHAGSGVEELGGTTFINASVCDEDYKPINPVRIIDV